MANLLLVDDEERILAGFSKALTGNGHNVETAGSGPMAISILESSEIDLVLTDLVMPDMGGLDLLKKIKSDFQGIPVIILTGHGTVETAVEAMKYGAYDYISKPFNLDEVEVIINRSLEHKKLIEENISLKNQLQKQYAFDNIVGNSNAIRTVYGVIDRVKNTKSTVLITGKSGSGKELVARAIHYNGFLKNKPFLTVDCGSLSENILESELFGHAKGSFTGAHRDKTGYFEEADGGTIFLDEIGEFTLGLQSRLLRFLQEGEFSRVGESAMRKVDVRVIAATNRDLDEMVEEGTFREDLFYRLNVITIHVPPLRSRLEDIPLLTNHFISKFNDKLNKSITSVSDDMMSLFANYNWPGNVRELENILENIITFCDDSILDTRHIPESISKRLTSRTDLFTSPQKEVIPFKEAKEMAMDEFTRTYLEALLDSCGWNVTNASRKCGLDRGHLYRLMKKFDVEK